MFKILINQEAKKKKKETKKQGQRLDVILLHVM